jgi:regulator of CtrA degradation
MSIASDLNRQIIDSLYSEALMLADEVRGAFDLSGRLDSASADEDLARIALSCEALRTTTRMMHVIAWLLNQKAFFNGEISEFQLRRQGRLSSPAPEPDRGQLAFLDEDIRELIERTRSFHARIQRLDNAWRERYEQEGGAVLRLRERLGAVFQSA